MHLKAFVIRKQQANEYDQQVTLYSKELGRVDAVAKSILKPNSIQAMHLDDMNLISCELVEGRAYPIITGAQSKRAFSGLKSNLSSLAVANYICESIYKMTFVYQSDENLWEFIADSFDCLDAERSADLKTLTKFGGRLLSVLGYSPNTEQCSFCASYDKPLVAFSPEFVGMICGECFLSGQKGILIKKNEHPVEASLQGIFESLTGTAFHSLTFAKAVLQ